MSDMLLDGMVKVAWVPIVTDLAAPTVADLTAGVELTERLTPDGLDVSSEDEMIDNSSLASTYSTEQVGRSKVTITLKYKADQDQANDDVKDALTYKALGFLAVRRGIAWDTDWTAAQNIELYPAQCGRPSPDAPAPNSLQTVTVRMASTSTPKAFGDEAVVAA